MRKSTEANKPCDSLKWRIHYGPYCKGARWLRVFQMHIDVRGCHRIACPSEAAFQMGQSAWASPRSWSVSRNKPPHPSSSPSLHSSKPLWHFNLLGPPTTFGCFLIVVCGGCLAHVEIECLSRSPWIWSSLRFRSSGRWWGRLWMHPRAT